MSIINDKHKKDLMIKRGISQNDLEVGLEILEARGVHFCRPNRGGLAVLSRGHRGDQINLDLSEKYFIEKCKTAVIDRNTERNVRSYF